MPDDKLKPAEPGDLADSIAFALCFSGRKRVHDSETFTATIAAHRNRAAFGAVRLRGHEETAEGWRRRQSRRQDWPLGDGTGPGQRFSGALEIFPNECLESSRWEFDLKDNVIIGGKPQRRRPSYCEVKCLRVAVGLNNVRIHIIGAPRYMHNIIQNRFLPSA